MAKIESNVPNLDAMTIPELMEFWKRHNRGRSYRELFPKGGQGTKNATGDLAAYASNLATAMRCRENGYVSRAQSFEKITDEIYNDLPEWARW